ncbi:hypothetical protein [Flavobacterium okayamense]|uniref:Uncharacterized protein n=1 Tax=Flavobacterium okayamense TaxID=2830782 RepID=A0ABM7SEA4_9FLAO|nr:hypothetical protein [Flavobacterium okayamense]BCY29128.1 hypothetical protein KK2020170_19960 [Flavobacterium okayamense]
MENKQAIKLIEKIQKNLIQNKFDVNETVEDLKKIREISLEEKNPTVTKSLRLAYEHLEANNAFLIAIPEDLDEEAENDEKTNQYSDSNDLESFAYYLELLTDLSKKNNVLDIKAYNQAFLEF